MSVVWRGGGLRHHNVHRCPACGRSHDSLSNARPDETEPPRPGDPALCIACGAINVLGEDGRLRRPTPDEFTELATDPDVRAARAAWIEMMSVLSSLDEAVDSRKPGGVH